MMLVVKVTLWFLLVFIILDNATHAASPAIVQASVNNPKFDFNSSETHEAIRAIHNGFANFTIAELQPGRAHKYFCEQPVAILYPTINKPNCDAKLIKIDKINIVVFYRTDSPLDVSYIGTRRGYSKLTADYIQVFPHVKQLFEAQDDHKLYTMFELGRIDAIVIEEQSAKQFALQNYPKILHSEFDVYVAVRGIDSKLLPSILSVSK